MTTPPTTPSYANIAASAARPRSISRGQLTKRTAANTSPEPQTIPRAPSANKSAASISREPRAAKQLPYVAPGRRTSTSQADGPRFSAAEAEQLSIPRGPAADNWRRGTSRNQNSDRHYSPRDAPSRDSYRPSYPDSRRHAPSSYPSSQGWDVPSSHGSHRQGNFEDLRPPRYSPYPNDRAYAPRSAPSNDRKPKETKVVNITLPAKGPEDESRDVSMAWHCKLPNDTSEMDFIRTHTTETAKTNRYDSIRVRMGIHNTKAKMTDRGLVSIPGEPFHFTVEYQKDGSPYVDASHIYTDTRRVGVDRDGNPIHKTVGLATAGVTKGANGKVVDKVIEIWPTNRSTRAKGLPNQTERIGWKYMPDLNNLDY